MTSELKSLLQKGDEESLSEIHELLWAYERGKIDKLPLDSIDTDVSPAINWNALEKIALQPTPLERLQGVARRIPAWLWPLMVAVVPVLIFLTFAWAYSSFPGAEWSERLIILMVAISISVLSALIIGLAAQLTYASAKRAASSSAPIESQARWAAASERTSPWAVTTGTLVILTLGVVLVSAWLHRGDRLLRAGLDALAETDYQQATHILEDATRLKPNDSQARLFLGVAQKRRYLIARALRDEKEGSQSRDDLAQNAAYNLRRAYELDRKNTTALAALGNLSLIRGDYESAEKWHRKALEIHRDNPVDHIHLALIEWARIRERIASYNADSTVKLVGSPEGLQLAQKLESAISRLERMRESSVKENDTLLLTLGKLYLTMAELSPKKEERAAFEEKATELLKEAASLPPSSSMLCEYSLAVH